ncbi:hypothetical protein EON76_02925 [bacterium]|nr:MAG: hypothetical protein EON76_02925 [bacterium]
MARLPQPGGDSGNWGDILNDYLAQSHKADGSIKDGSVGSTQLQSNAVTAATLAPNSVTSNALASDSVDATTIVDGSITKTKLTTSVQASLDKADSSTQPADLAVKANDNTVVHLSESETITGAKNFTGGATVNGTGIVIATDIRLSDMRMPIDNSITTIKVQDAAITETKLASGVQAKLNNINGLTTAAADMRYLNRRSRSTARVKVNLPANFSASGWAFSGGQSGLDTGNSNINDTTDAMYGDRSLKLVTNGNGAQTNARIIMSTAKNVSDCDVRLHMKFSDVNISAFRVVVGNSGLTAVSTSVVFGLGGVTDGTISKPWQIGRWATFDVPKSSFSGNADWTQIQRVQIVASDTNTATTIRLHGVEFVQQDPFSVNPRGTVVFSFDDSYATQYTVALPLLEAKGWKATLMPIVDQIDTTPTYLTLAQVQDLHDTHGWEVGAHCYSGSSHTIGLPSLSSSQRRTEFEAILSWQDSYGFRSPSHSYPLGNHDAATEADVAMYFSASRCATWNLNETICPPRRYALQALNVTAGSSAILAAAQSAAANKGVLIIFGHNFVTSGGTSNDITPAAFADIVNAVATSGCDVLTMDQMLSLTRVA